MKKPKSIRSADETYLHLNKTDNFQEFFKVLIEFLQKKLKKVEIDGGHYYTCGQAHERYNQNWKPFENLWKFTERRGLDFYAIKDLLDDFFFRELWCECEILGGDKELRRRELERSGVYFGEIGRREADVI